MSFHILIETGCGYLQPMTNVGRLCLLYEERFEDTKGVIRSRTSKDQTIQWYKDTKGIIRSRTWKDQTMQWPKKGQQD